MVTISKLPVLSAALSVAFFGAGCGKNNEDTGTPYCPPVANAGEDQSVSLGQSISLDASASGYDEGCQIRDLTFEWAFDAIPVDSALAIDSFTDNNSGDAVTTAFIPDVVGTYVVSLTVCDIIDCSETDLIVLEVASSDATPIADAGPDFNSLVGERVELDGSGSYDPENMPLEYSWVLSSVPDCSALTSADLYNPNTTAPAIVTDCEGVYVAGLAVSDGTSWSDPDFATITASSTDLAPIADAGDSETLAPCVGSEIPLNGNGSYDPEGATITYSWGLVSAPAESTVTDANFDDPTSSTPLFTWDLEGSYTFQLQVNDGVLDSAPDLVTYEVQGSNMNRSPIANAGGDQSVDLTTDCTSATYVSWECEDCAETEFDLDGSNSADPDGDSLTFSWSESTGTLPISGAHTAFATATVASKESTYDETSTEVYDITLSVEDCSLEDSETISLTITCTGESAN